MRDKIKCIIILFLILAGCISTPYEENNIYDSIGVNSRTMILNYENRSVKYKNSITDSHMRIYIEIEKPFLINIPPLSQMEKIYSIAGVEGTTVYHLELNDKGAVISSKKTLSAGLGMDEIAEDILRQIKIEPAYLAGKPGVCSADLKIIFKMDEAE